MRQALTVIKERIDERQSLEAAAAKNMEQNAREADQGRSNEGRSNEGSSEATPPRAHSLLGTFLESSTRGIPLTKMASQRAALLDGASL